MPKAYEGNEPYIFISYAHKDQEEVLRYIDALESRGFRIWFDGGIQAGSEWPENIARHLRKCACVISFVSESFVDSDNCRRELTFSQDLKIEQLSVFLRDLQPKDLPDGIRLQLGLNQAMFRENFDSEEAFVEEIARAPMMQECLGDKVAVTASEQGKKGAEKVRFTERFYTYLYEHSGGTTEREKKEHWTRVSKALVWIVILIELAYIPISNSVVGIMANQGYGYIFIALVLMAVHLLLAWCNLSFFVFTRAFVKRAGVDHKPLRDARFYMNLATLASFLVPIITEVEILLDAPVQRVFYFLPPPFSAIVSAVVLNAYPAAAALLFYMLLNEKKK